jgi:hypothetical protein
MIELRLQVMLLAAPLSTIQCKVKQRKDSDLFIVRSLWLDGTASTKAYWMAQLQQKPNHLVLDRCNTLL